MADYDISKLPHSVQQALMQLTETIVQAWPSAAGALAAPVTSAPEVAVIYEPPRGVMRRRHAGTGVKQIG